MSGTQPSKRANPARIQYCINATRKPCDAHLSLCKWEISAAIESRLYLRATQSIVTDKWQTTHIITYVQTMRLILWVFCEANHHFACDEYVDRTTTFSFDVLWRYVFESVPCLWPAWFVLAATLFSATAFLSFCLWRAHLFYLLLSLCLDSQMQLTS